MALSLLGVDVFAAEWSLPFWVFIVFALQFFRDPAREIPQNPEAVLSPVDGRICGGLSAHAIRIVMSMLENQYFKERVQRAFAKNRPPITVTKVVYNSVNL